MLPTMFPDRLRSLALSLRRGAGLALAVLSLGCSSKSGSDERRSQPEPAPARSVAEVEATAETTPPPVDTAADEARKRIYLVSREKELYSFDPRVDGLAAYRRVGALRCPTSGSPQAMSVDRRGVAWIFYDTLELFEVRTSDASCSPTEYKHPTTDYVLGMSFTAVSPGSAAEQLYVDNPTFGLATVSMPDLKVTPLHRFGGIGELSGGGDGRLFRFNSIAATLSEVDRGALTVKLVRQFETLTGVRSFAFARFAGRFYVFTTIGASQKSRLTVYDPATNEEKLRDADVGFNVVGAGQSTLVPKDDGKDAIHEPAPH